MFLDRRFSTHCWNKRGPNETHVRTRKTSLVANPQSPKKCRESACKIKVVVHYKLLQDSERTPAMVTRWSVYGKMPTQMHPHETSRKTSAKPWVAWSRVSRCGTTGQQSSERLNKNKKQHQRSIMGQIQEVRVAAGEKSLGKAPPRMHRCQAMSSVALETRAVHCR